MPAATHTLRILHLSDLHERGPREAETWRRRRVLGDPWERNPDAFRSDHSGLRARGLLEADGRALSSVLAEWLDEEEAP